MFKELKDKKWLVWVLVGACELALLLLVFRVGEVIGVNRANFDTAWGENYSRFFGGTPRPEGLLEEFNELPPPVPAFGNTGTVLSVSGGRLVIQDNHLNEKTVTISSSTTIRLGAGTISASQIPDGAQIVIIGAPNQQGEIVARFIRIFPSGAASSTGN